MEPSLYPILSFFSFSLLLFSFSLVLSIFSSLYSPGCSVHSYEVATMVCLHAPYNKLLTLKKKRKRDLQWSIIYERGRKIYKMWRKQWLSVRGG